MKVPEFSGDELQSYVEFMLNQFRRADGFWFLRVESKCGYDAAIVMNEEVWDRMGKLMAREIMERFSVQEKGLEGFARVLRYYPWAIISGYRIEQGDGEIIISVPHCPSQEARLRQGMGEYHCREMHYREFMGMVTAVDQNIRTECLFAPPDPHPGDLFCKWRFSLIDDTGSITHNRSTEGA